LKTSLKPLLKTTRENPNSLIQKWSKKGKKSLKTDSDSDSSDSDELNFEEEGNLFKQRKAKKDFNLDDLVNDLDKTNKKKKKKGSNSFQQKGLMDFEDELDFAEMLLNDVAPGREEDFQIPKPTGNNNLPRRKKRDHVYKRNITPIKIPENFGMKYHNNNPPTPKLPVTDPEMLDRIPQSKPEAANQRQFKQKLVTPYISPFKKINSTPKTENWETPEIFKIPSELLTKKEKSIFDDDFEFDDIVIHEVPPKPEKKDRRDKERKKYF
jgi:hypothetical protein